MGGEQGRGAEDWFGHMKGDGETEPLYIFFGADGDILVCGASSGLTFVLHASLIFFGFLFWNGVCIYYAN